jgi:hypothetical protein
VKKNQLIFFKLYSPGFIYKQNNGMGVQNCCHLAFGFGFKFSTIISYFMKVIFIGAGKQEYLEKPICHKTRINVISIMETLRLKEYGRVILSKHMKAKKKTVDFLQIVQPWVYIQTD